MGGNGSIVFLPRMMSLIFVSFYAKGQILPAPKFALLLMLFSTVYRERLGNAAPPVFIR
jgi:hypothetical protein